MHVQHINTMQWEKQSIDTKCVTPRLLSVVWRKLKGQIGNLLTRYFGGKLVIKLFNLIYPPPPTFLPHFHIDISLPLDWLPLLSISLSFYLTHPPKHTQTHSSSHLLHHFFPLSSRNLPVREDYVSIDSPSRAKTPWDFEVQETQGKNLSFLSISSMKSFAFC